MRIHTFPDDPPGFVLVEAQVDKTPQEIAGLGVALTDREAHLPRNGTGIFVAQVGIEITRRGVADA